MAVDKADRGILHSFPAPTVMLRVNENTVRLDDSIAFVSRRLEFQGAVPRQLLDLDAHTLQAARQAKFIRLPVCLSLVSVLLCWHIILCAWRVAQTRWYCGIEVTNTLYR